MNDEVALTLKQAAERLGMSYYTLFRKRHSIAFRLPGSRIWRVWPSTLAAMDQKRNNLIRLSLRHGQEKECLFANKRGRSTGGLTSPHQTAKELGTLLALQTDKKLRNTTTD